MKIYEIGTGYTPIPARMGAATEIVVEELTKAFLKQGQDVQIIDIAAENRAPHELPIREVTVPKCFSGTDVQLGLMHKLKRVVYSVALAGQLQKILKESAERVVLHFHNQYNLFFFLKLTPKKLREKAWIAYTVHSHIWHGEWTNIKEAAHKRYFQEIYCMQQADRVFVLNENTQHHLVQHLQVNPQHISLINNGVNSQTYYTLEESKKQKNKQKENLADKSVVIQVGSVCERKNQLTSLRLMLPLMKRDDRIVFCYAGGIVEPEYQTAIEEYARRNGIKEQVRYFGELQPQQELNEFYNLAQAMVFPSKAEGFSLVVLEAMSAGIPVLIPETLQFKLAEQCLQFRDENHFADCLEKWILNRNNQQKLSAHVRNVVVKNYSWEKIAADYLSVLSQ